MRKLMWFAILALLAGCGKNDGFTSVGGYGYPYGGGGYYGTPPINQPPANLPLPPQNYPPPYQQMPQQFGPVYGYFAQQPQYMPYWNNLWQGWLNYAQPYGIYPYDWNTFWNGYCQNNYQDLYNYLEINIYYY